MAASHSHRADVQPLYFCDLEANDEQPMFDDLAAIPQLK